MCVWCAEGATAMSTLCSPPGTRKQVPLVVHSARGVLYEEPLVACLAVTLDCVQVLRHSSAGGSGSLGGADSRSEASFDLANASPMAPSSSGGTGTKLFNRLFHRKRRTSSSASGDERSHRASRSFSNRGSGGYGMLAGEDQGDECERGPPPSLSACLSQQCLPSCPSCTLGSRSS